MIYKHNRRLVVQKPDSSAKYILPVVSAMTDHSYPFTVPTASIEVIANDGQGLYDYISDVDFDDIVRLQVSNTYSEQEKEVWEDVFEGRIISQKSQWGTGTTATPMCVGHAHQASYFNIPASYTTTSVDAGTIVSNWNTAGLDRIQITCPVSPTFSMPYTAEKDKKYLKDVFTDVENAGGYGYYFSAVPTYDNALNLISPVNVEFRQLPTTPTNKYEVIQGSPRLLSANFTVTGEALYNQIIYYGATANDIQVVGGDSDPDSIEKYSMRTYVGTDNSLAQGDCSAFANGMLPYTDALKVSGTVTLLGTPKAQVGDYAHIKVGSVDVPGAITDLHTQIVNSASLEAYMHVVRVSHNMRDDFTTTLQFGRVQKGPPDYIAQFNNNSRKIKNMFIN
jgi:hypothetical protein